MFTRQTETPKKERRITVKVTEALHRAVRIRAAELGCPISEIVRGLLKAWLAGDIELPDKEETAERN